jgi:alanine racemase
LHAQQIAKNYFPNLLCHLSATYGALLGKDYVFDMTRIGIGLYGYTPVGITAPFPLQKGMEVYAPVTATRKYLGGGAGYGNDLTDTFQGNSLSVLRVGYADGFLRTQQNGIDGYEQNANNLCMDACVRVGKYKKGTLLPILTNADETARLTNTISYEVLCAATRRAEFVFDYD